MSALVPFSEAVRLDAELVRLGRGMSAVRLGVGAALDALASSGGHHELGFSSFEAYARERCERTGRWAADTRALARRLVELPRMREALCAGAIGWSTAELLARHVSPDSEVAWLERARDMTVRELRALLNRQACDAQGDAAEEDGHAPDADEETRSLKISSLREDAWFFEGARKIADAVAGPMTADRVLQALLAEGYSTLLEFVPEAACAELHEIEQLEGDAAFESDVRSAWHAELRRLRNDAEVLVEGRWPLEPCWVDMTELPAVSRTAEALDREIRRLCVELTQRDLALGVVAERARRAEVWERLGFASEAQHARERVGVSLSSLKAKRILAARSERLPELASAVSTGRLGYEAAYLVSRVATPKTVAEWIERAEQRTVKHLREEVEASELLVRMGHGRDQSPLDEESLELFFELERRVVSGEVLESAGESQMSGGRMRRFGRVTLRWTVRATTARFFRALERAYARVSSRCGLPARFLRFLCENFYCIWLPVLRRARLTGSGELPEYYGVYRRDRFRCTSPVCARRDVTPHHLRFRSQGGGDEDENVASLCVWCHLCGIHEGRIRAEPPASRIRWRIGRTGALVVEGRTRSHPFGRAVNAIVTGASF